MTANDDPLHEGLKAVEKMGEPKFTPGPWEASEVGDYSDFDGNSIVILGDDMRLCVVHVSLGSAVEQESRANAHLIAAAPKMYEALKYITEWLSATRQVFGEQFPMDEFLKEPRAALAKARGETP